MVTCSILSLRVPYDLSQIEEYMVALRYGPRAPGIPGNNDPQKFPREFPGIFEKIRHRPREIPGIMVTNISRGNCRELSKNYITGTQNSLK